MSQLEYEAAFAIDININRNLPGLDIVNKLFLPRLVSTCSPVLSAVLLDLSMIIPPVQYFI